MPGWLAHSAKLSSHFTDICFLKVGISAWPWRKCSSLWKGKKLGKGNHPLESQVVESITSQYKRNQRQCVKDMIFYKSDPFSFCGKHGLGKNSPSHLRKQYCQAYNSKYNYCHKLHHHEKVCRLKQKNKGVQRSHQILSCHYLIVCALPTPHRISTLHPLLHWITMFLIV